MQHSLGDGAAQPGHDLFLVTLSCFVLPSPLSWAPLHAASIIICDLLKILNHMIERVVTYEAKKGFSLCE